MEIKTKLMKKVAKTPTICSNCQNQITIGDMYHLEEGTEQHIHSLIARKYCSDCYAKYGEQKLLKGTEQ
jgi:hypothetical protein